MTEGGTSVVGASELRERLADDALREVGALSRAITERIHGALPGLGNEPETLAATYASTLANCEMILLRLREGSDLSVARPPENAIAWAHDLVHRGIEMPALMRAYRIGVAVFDEHWARRVRASEASSEAMIEVLVVSHQQVHAYIDSVLDDLAAIYAAERERWAPSAEAMRAEVVRTVLSGEPVDPRDAERRLRHALDGPQLGFVVWAGDGLGMRPQLANAARVIADHAHAITGAAPREPLIVPLGRGLVAAWVTGDAASVSPAELAARPLEVPDSLELRAAIGIPATGIDGFRETHLAAVQAKRVARLCGRRSGSVTNYDSVALVALASADIDHAAAFVARELGPLAATDDTTRRLAATLRAYLEEGRSRTRTARRLGVHQNTVLYRVKQASELLGREPDERPVELEVALALATVLGERFGASD